MSDSPPASREDFLNKALDTAIRIGAVVLLAAWCFQIVRPFITPVVWGIIIAVAAYPGYHRLQGYLGDRRGIAAVVFTLIAIVILIVPTVILSDTLIYGARELGARLQEGSVAIPPPPERVAGWPIIGTTLSDFWALASENLSEALERVQPQLRALGAWLLSAVAGLGFAILQFIFAIIIAAALMVHAESGYSVSRAIIKRLAGERGERIVDLAEATVRSVAKGILGVAIIQSILAGMGFLAVGLPGAGLLAVICLLLAIIQIGPALVLIGTVIYVFATANTLVAVIFMIWCIFVGVIDNFLKPILLGRGVDVPMLVIFVGAIGGFLSMGIIGLFVGSIVLVLGYTLLLAWLDEERQAEPVSEKP